MRRCHITGQIAAVSTGIGAELLFIQALQIVQVDGNKLKCNLFSGTDRSLFQDENPHIVFSDAYNNLLSFSYAADDAVQKNFAYVLGCGEGNARKRTTF